MRDKILKKLAGWHSRYPWRMVLISLVLTILFAAAATHLKVTMRWSDLLPAKDPRTIQFNRIVEEFTAATSLVVVVQGEEPRIKEYADVLAPRILELIDSSQNKFLKKKIDKLQRRLENKRKKDGGAAQVKELEEELSDLESRVDRRLFRRVDYRTEVEFLCDYGLMLVKAEDLENLLDIFFDPNLAGLLQNINQAMEKEYVQREESLSTREKEDQAVIFLDAIQNLYTQLKRAAEGEKVPVEEIRQTADKLLFGESYMLSYDERALVLNAIPNFSMMDTDYLVTGTDRVQELLTTLRQDFPDVEAGLTGFVAVGRDEMVYAEKSLGYTTLIAAAAILLLLMLSFRMWTAPILALGNLLIGLVWAVGTAALVVGQLNIMTQMMAVILLGLGIDFSIHILSGFSEMRALGKNISSSMEITLGKIGRGILTGGLTTACAFLALLISHSRGMKEMGLVTGTGLLAILMATFLFLPALLVLRERRLEKKAARSQRAAKVQRDISFRFLGRAAEWLGRHYIFTGAAALGLTILLAWAGIGITFDHNYMNIEPKGLPSVELQDTILDKFDMSLDYALIIADSVDQSREISRTLKSIGSVALTEDLSLYLPSPDQQQKRIPYIKEIKARMSEESLRKEVVPEEIAALLEETERAEMNVMEMQDMAFLGGQDKVDAKCQTIVGDPENPGGPNIFQDAAGVLAESPGALEGLNHFQRYFSSYFHDAVLHMCTFDSVEWEDLPESILNRYTNPDRTGFLITAFPAGSVWKDSQFLKRFVEDLEGVTDLTTGMPSVFRALIEIIGRDGQYAMALTLVVVFLLLWIDFRSPGYALMALIPLGIGVFWMIGFMRLCGMQLTVMNVMGFPMILGIGIDDGVHIVHRLKQEGAARIGLIFSSTGKAILLTSLTTMLGFGSLVFSLWRGFGHLGGALFLGVAACFLTTVVFLTAIIGGMNKRRQREMEKR